jgi:WD40 repeat protein
LKENNFISKFSTYEGHLNPIYAICHGFKPNTFLSAGEDRFIVEWELGQPIGKTIAMASATVYAILALSSRKILFIGQSNGIVSIINIATSSEEKSIKIHEKGVFSITEIPNKPWVICSGADGEITLINAETFECVWQRKYPGGKIRELSIKANSDECCFGNSDGYLVRINISTGNPIEQTQLLNSKITSTLYSRDNQAILIATHNASLHFYWPDNHDISPGIPAHNFAIYRLRWHPHYKFIASASRDKSIKLWSPSPFEFLAKIEHKFEKGHRYSVNTILFSYDGNFLLSAGDDKKIIQWKLNPQMI